MKFKQTILGIIMITFLFFMVNPVLAHAGEGSSDSGSMMNGGWQIGMNFIWIIFIILVIISLVLLIIWLIKKIGEPVKRKNKK